jgi:hypothetical protein
MALEELTAFFDSNEHGSAATFTRAGQAGVAVTCIFRNEFFAVDDGMVAVESSQPLVTVQSSKVSGVAHGDTMTIDGVTYNIVAIKPDGTGITDLVLEAQ